MRSTPGTALRNFVSREIKWTEELEHYLDRGATLSFKAERVRTAAYRPFVKRKAYYDRIITHRVYQQDNFFPIESAWKNSAFCLSGLVQASCQLLAVDSLPDLHFIGDSQTFPLKFWSAGQFVDNITDWALKQFTAHYADDIGKGKTARIITKEGIFHYCYAVLHDPVYRDKYAQNLKREFPRIPFYADFWRWAAWGEALMAMHIGYETVEPFALSRMDEPDAKVRAAGLSPKALLRSDMAAGTIELDSETTLRGIPAQAWHYKLGNRCAIDWVLDQYKEKKPKDPTIREKFDAYRFADYKEKVIDLLMRVTTVSVETGKVVDAMKAINR